MKKIVIITAIICFLQINSFSQATRFTTMIGSWQIVSDDEPGGRLDVIDSNTIIIKFMGEEKKLTGCKIDFSRSPYWFDFSATDTTTAFSNFKSLLDFVNDDTMRWQVFIDEDRPDHFTSDGGELFYLRRIHNKPAALASAGQ
jgi:hypothetical protein